MTEQDSDSGLQESRTLRFKPSAQQRWSGGTFWRQWGSHPCFKGFSPPALCPTLALGLSMGQTPLRACSSTPPYPELSRQPVYPLWWLPGRESAPGRQLISPSCCLYPVSQVPFHSPPLPAPPPFWPACSATVLVFLCLPRSPHSQRCAGLSVQVTSWL